MNMVMAIVVVAVVAAACLGFVASFFRRPPSRQRRARFETDSSTVSTMGESHAAGHHTDHGGFDGGGHGH